MPCGHHFGHHFGPTSPYTHSCPYCGWYHPAAYGAGWQQSWAGYPFAYPPFPPPGYAPFGPHPWGPPSYAARTEARTDEEIKRAIGNALRADPRIPPEAKIEVEVQNGIVTLTGSVPDKWVKHTVNELVFSLPGVVDVRNNLQVSRPTR